MKVLEKSLSASYLWVSIKRFRAVFNIINYKLGEISSQRAESFIRRLREIRIACCLRQPGTQY